MRDKKTHFIANIIKNNVNVKVNRVLVVGCGSGLEAAILKRCFQTDVIGIDIVEDFDPDAARLVRLQQGDAMDLKFEDESFDFIYSYHALEHIQHPIWALKEINRVLTLGGCCWIGTPNRHRAIGYLGSKDATFHEKLKWNLTDWKARFNGKFKNEMGAHAGFSAIELNDMLTATFSEIQDMTYIYFQVLYKRYSFLLRALQLSGLSVVVYPSIYFMAVK